MVRAAARSGPAPTIATTTIPDLIVGDVVNLERSVEHGAEIGGHHLSGHVDCVGAVSTVEEHGGGVAHVWIDVPPEMTRYVFAKGFIAVDGISLTVSDHQEGRFGVWIIPETRRSTRMQGITPGARVNLEFHKGVQVVVDTIRRGLAELARSGVSQLGRDEQAALRRLLELPDPRGPAAKTAAEPGSSAGCDIEA